jgi:hypothetical protein
MDNGAMEAGNEVYRVGGRGAEHGGEAGREGTSECSEGSNLGREREDQRVF